jgi:thiol-disulfide isomerase/thioredoxin
MSKPTLIIVTSKTCGACRSYKANVAPALLGALRKDNRIQVGEIDLDTMSSPLPSTYPKELKKFIGWYPTFILLAPMRGNNLEGVVFNGDMSKGHVTGPNGSRPISVEGITAWINQELTSNPLFSQPRREIPNTRRMIYRPSNY